MGERGKRGREDKEGTEKWGSGWERGEGGRRREGRECKCGRENGGGGDGRRAGGRRREREGKMLGWQGKSKPANHEAESAYVTDEGEAGENVMKFSEICGPAGPEAKLFV